jgi:hypothetical protein
MGISFAQHAEPQKQESRAPLRARGFLTQNA